MREETFKKNMAEAQKRAQSSEIYHSDFWLFYQTGLQKHYHGEGFGTPEQHRVLMDAADGDEDQQRHYRGLGYRAGFEGKPVMEAGWLLMRVLYIPACVFAENSGQYWESEGDYQKLAENDRIADELRYWSYIKSQMPAVKFEIFNNLDIHYRGITSDEMYGIYETAPDDRSNIQYNNDIVIEFERYFGVRFCRRCNWVWVPRVKDPVTCPNCGSTRWSVNRTGNEPGPKPRKKEE